MRPIYFSWISWNLQIKFFRKRDVQNECREIRQWRSILQRDLSSNAQPVPIPCHAVCIDYSGCFKTGGQSSRTMKTFSIRHSNYIPFSFSSLFVPYSSCLRGVHLTNIVHLSLVLNALDCNLGHHSSCFFVRVYKILVKKKNHKG